MKDSERGNCSLSSGVVVTDGGHDMSSIQTVLRPHDVRAGSCVWLCLMNWVSRWVSVNILRTRL
jgi:hypothetical protein